jgi:hypothetical protein
MEILQKKILYILKRRTTLVLITFYLRSPWCAPDSIFSFRYDPPGRMSPGSCQGSAARKVCRIHMDSTSKFVHIEDTNNFCVEHVSSRTVLMRVRIHLWLQVRSITWKNTRILPGLYGPHSKFDLDDPKRKVLFSMIRTTFVLTIFFIWGHFENIPTDFIIYYRQGVSNFPLS